MYYFLAAVGSALISIMIVINGQLTETCDSFAASTIIHLAGLLLISFLLFIRKENPLHLKRLSPVLFTGGAIGVCTTLFNNAAFGKINVSAILALGLFAQAVTSLLIDQFGIFHMPAWKFNRAKLPGFLGTLIGILFLMAGSSFVWLPVLLSLFSGITVVASRSVNAELAESASPLVSTWYNYVVGLVVSLLFWAGAALTGTSVFSITFSGPLWIYTGGLIGVGTVLILNLTVKKMPAFILTLLMFVGQLFTGILLDILLGEPLSVSQLAGGALTAGGLILNLWLDQKKPAA